MRSYIIDGYNLFFYLKEETNPFEKTRENFIEALNELFTSLRLHAVLIFDSHQDFASTFPRKKPLEALEIIFSPKNLNADQYILEYLSAETHPEQKIIVTSDRELANRVKELGAKTKTTETFFKMLLRWKAKKTSRQKEKKMQTESSYDFNRLLQAFEKQLKDESSN